MSLALGNGKARQGMETIYERRHTKKEVDGGGWLRHGEAQETQCRVLKSLSTATTAGKNDECLLGQRKRETPLHTLHNSPDDHGAQVWQVSDTETPPKLDGRILLCEGAKSERDT